MCTANEDEIKYNNIPPFKHSTYLGYHNVPPQSRSRTASARPIIQGDPNCTDTERSEPREDNTNPRIAAGGHMYASRSRTMITGTALK